MLYDPSAFFRAISCHGDSGLSPSPLNWRRKLSVAASPALSVLILLVVEWSCTAATELRNPRTEVLRLVVQAEAGVAKTRQVRTALENFMVLGIRVVLIDLVGRICR
jgi:hypothetical protein